MTGGRFLVVDLDGTLVRSDMLLETFWSAFAHSWKTPFRAVQSLAMGRAVLKQRMAGDGPVDVDRLPYNASVLDYIARWRAEGGRTALVTASNQDVAARIAEHLGVFDEVYGSDGATNLKGENKARFLVGRYGDRGFDYIGDARADVPVWQKAMRAIMVNVPPVVRRAVEGAGRGPGREIVDLSASLPHAALPHAGAWGRVMRPHQWMKNLLVFLPLLAAHRIDGESLLLAALAFVAFSLVASSVYVLNDLLDLASDRAHPRKRNRPFASGALPLVHGTWLAPGLLLAGLGVAMLLGQQFLLVILGYYAATMAYSLVLKRQPVIDICTLAGLYTLRIVAGGVATGIEISVWLLAFSIFFFFSLAAVKRQAELVDGKARGLAGAHGRGYRIEDLQLVTAMATASGYIAILVLALYINSPDVTELYRNPPVLWGICMVMFYWINRIVMLTHRGEMHDDPVVFAATDKTSLICFATVVALAVGGSF